MAGNVEPRRGAAARLGRLAMGERLGGFIYGTIVVLAVIVGGARSFPHEPGHIASLVAVTVVVLWLAHVYSHALGHAVAREEHLSFEEFRRIAHRELSIVEAAVPSVAALALGSIGVISTHTAVWIALLLGLGVLAAQGVMFSRAERLGTIAMLGVVAANLGLGLLLIGLKIAVSH